MENNKTKKENEKKKEQEYQIITEDSTYADLGFGDLNNNIYKK